MQSAQLVFDSASAGHLLGARAALAGDERSLVFSVGDVSIDLVAFEPGGGLQMIHGQIVDAHDRGVEARVRLGDHGDVVETDAFGQFAVSTMAPQGGLKLQASMAGLDALCALPPTPFGEAC